MPMMRGHNEGSLFRRKTGQWIALVTMRDGRRVSRWAKTRDEAKAELAELLRLRDAGAPITGKIRLGQYLERWVSDDHGWAPSTRRKHESAVRVHLAGSAIGHLRLSEVSVADVDSWLRGVVLHPQSKRHLRGTLRRALADAHRDGLVTRNVGALSKAPPLPNRERTILDANQARILIESTRGTRYGPLWTILVTTGLRISEALGLRWSDVDFGGTSDETGVQPAVVGASGTTVRRPVSPRRDAGLSVLSGDIPGASRRGSGSGAGGARRQGPSITVRHQLARENGEWVRRAPKTAKGRRTIPLTPLGVEALRAQRAMQREWRFGDGANGSMVAARGTTGATASVEVSGEPVGAAPTANDRKRLLAAPVGGMRGAPVVAIDGLVFTTSTGHPLHGTNVVKRLANDLAAAGLPHVTLHDLRHSAATILFSQGLPIEAIADLLGHSTVRVTQDLYRHSVQSFSVLAAERMQEALG